MWKCEPRDTHRPICAGRMTLRPAGDVHRLQCQACDTKKTTNSDPRVLYSCKPHAPTPTSTGSPHPNHIARTRLFPRHEDGCKASRPPPSPSPPTNPRSRARLYKKLRAPRPRQKGSMHQKEWTEPKLASSHRPLWSSGFLRGRAFGGSSIKVRFERLMCVCVLT